MIHTYIKKLEEIWPNIAGATLLTIMKARNQNADPNYPLKMNAKNIYNEIRDTILSIAKAERRKAEIKVKTLEYAFSTLPKKTHALSPNGKRTGERSLNTPAQICNSFSKT